MKQRAIDPAVAVAMRPVDEALAELRAFGGRTFAQRDDGLCWGGGLGVWSGIDGLLGEGVIGRPAAGAEQKQTGDEFHPSNLTTGVGGASGPNRHECRELREK